MKLEGRRTEYDISIDNDELNQIYWALKQSDCGSCQYENCSSRGGTKKNCRMLACDLAWETATPRYKADA